jgi:hypothetical protein
MVASSCQNSGLAIGGSFLFQASQTCNLILVTDKVTNECVNVFPSGTNYRDEDLEISATTAEQSLMLVRIEEHSDYIFTAPGPPIPQSNPPGTPPPVTSGRMTGGGSVFTTSNTRITHGFVLHCNPNDLPNNLEINWGEGNNFHLESLATALCFDDPVLQQKPPAANFDTYQGVASGSYNGIPGAKATWTFTDAGEPGTQDFARIDILDAGGNLVLSVANLLAKGDQQAH